MHWNFIIAVLGFCLMLLSSPYAVAGLSQHWIDHGSLRRTYLKYAPEGLGTAAVPLVLVLHGGGMSAQQASAAGSTESEWMKIADEEGLIVLYPQAVDAAWVDCRSDNVIRPEGVDDVGFLSAVIEETVRENMIDRRQIYVRGASNGGMMAMRMALEKPSYFAALGLSIANVPLDPRGMCPRKPPERIPVWLCLGDRDEWMPYQGGFIMDQQERGRVLSGPDTLAYWVDALGLGDIKSNNYGPIPGAEKTGLARRVWVREGKPGLVFVLVEGGGHTLPSKAHPLPQVMLNILGPQSYAIESARDCWEFFKLHRRP